MALPTSPPSSSKCEFLECESTCSDTNQRHRDNNSDHGIVMEDVSNHDPESPTNWSNNRQEKINASQLETNSSLELSRKHDILNDKIQEMSVSSDKNSSSSISSPTPKPKIVEITQTDSKEPPATEKPTPRVLSRTAPLRGRPRKNPTETPENISADLLTTSDVKKSETMNKPTKPPTRGRPRKNPIKNKDQNNETKSKELKTNEVNQLPSTKSDNVENSETKIVNARITSETSPQAKDNLTKRKLLESPKRVPRPGQKSDKPVTPDPSNVVEQRTTNWQEMELVVNESLTRKKVVWQPPKPVESQPETTPKVKTDIESSSNVSEKPKESISISEIEQKESKNDQVEKLNTQGQSSESNASSQSPKKDNMQNKQSNCETTQSEVNESNKNSTQPKEQRRLESKESFLSSDSEASNKSNSQNKISTNSIESWHSEENPQDPSNEKSIAEGPVNEDIFQSSADDEIEHQNILVELENRWDDQQPLVKSESSNNCVTKPENDTIQPPPKISKVEESNNDQQPEVSKTENPVENWDTFETVSDKSDQETTDQKSTVLDQPKPVEAKANGKCWTDFGTSNSAVVPQFKSWNSFAKIQYYETQETAINCEKPENSNDSKASKEAETKTDPKSATKENPKVDPANVQPESENSSTKKSKNWKKLDLSTSEDSETQSQLSIKPTASKLVEQPKIAQEKLPEIVPAKKLAPELACNYFQYSSSSDEEANLKQKPSPNKSKDATPKSKATIDKIHPETKKATASEKSVIPHNPFEILVKERRSSVSNSESTSKIKNYGKNSSLVSSLKPNESVKLNNNEHSDVDESSSSSQEDFLSDEEAGQHNNKTEGKLIGPLLPETYLNSLHNDEVSESDTDSRKSVNRERSLSNSNDAQMAGPPVLELHAVSESQSSSRRLTSKTDPEKSEGKKFNQPVSKSKNENKSPNRNNRRRNSNSKNSDTRRKDSNARNSNRSNHPPKNQDRNRTSSKDSRSSSRTGRSASDRRNKSPARRPSPCRRFDRRSPERRPDPRVSDHRMERPEAWNSNRRSPEGRRLNNRSPDRRLDRWTPERFPDRRRDLRSPNRRLDRSNSNTCQDNRRRRSPERLLDRRSPRRKPEHRTPERNRRLSDRLREESYLETSYDSPHRHDRARLPDSDPYVPERNRGRRSPIRRRTPSTIQSSSISPPPSKRARRPSSPKRFRLDDRYPRMGSPNLSSRAQFPPMSKIRNLRDHQDYEPSIISAKHASFPEESICNASSKSSESRYSTHHPEASTAAAKWKVLPESRDTRKRRETRPPSSKTDYSPYHKKQDRKSTDFIDTDKLFKNNSAGRKELEQLDNFSKSLYRNISKDSDQTHHSSDSRDVIRVQPGSISRPPPSREIYNSGSSNSGHSISRERPLPKTSRDQIESQNLKPDRHPASLSPDQQAEVETHNSFETDRISTEMSLNNSTSVESITESFPADRDSAFNELYEEVISSEKLKQAFSQSLDVSANHSNKQVQNLLKNFPRDVIIRAQKAILAKEIQKANQATKKKLEVIEKLTDQEQILRKFKYKNLEVVQDDRQQLNLAKTFMERNEEYSRNVERSFERSQSSLISEEIKRRKLSIGTASTVSTSRTISTVSEQSTSGSFHASSTKPGLNIVFHGARPMYQAYTSKYDPATKKSDIDRSKIRNLLRQGHFDDSKTNPLPKYIPHIQGTVLKFSNVPASLDEDSFLDYLTKYGAVRNIRIKRDEKVAHITMVNEADAIIVSKKRLDYEGTTLYVSIENGTSITNKLKKLNLKVNYTKIYADSLQNYNENPDLHPKPFTPDALKTLKGKFDFYYGRSMPDQINKNDKNRKNSNQQNCVQKNIHIDSELVNAAFNSRGSNSPKDFVVRYK